MSQIRGETARVQPPARGVRRFGRVNWVGLSTLCQRECIRFLKVFGQTLIAPVATAALFLTVFTLAFGEARGLVETTPFAAFIAPGVVMMSVVQNAFANTSSSLMVAKVQGNIVDTLMPPLSPAEIAAGFAVGGVARGALIAVLASAALFPMVGVGLAQPLWAAFFAVCGSALLALVGVAAAIWSPKFDHLAAVTNFVITPLAFLSGTFYSIDSLPDFWRGLSLWNPMFYLIDGYRYGALGVSDADPRLAAAVTLGATLAAWALCWRLLARGYRLKP